MRRKGRNKRNFVKKNDNTKQIIHVLSRTIIMLLILFSIVTFFTILNNWKDYKELVQASNMEVLQESVEENLEESSDDTASNTDTTFTLTAIGDIVGNTSLTSDALNTSTNQYDFSYIFEDISYYIKNSSITVANLETTFSGEDNGYRNYSRYNSPDKLANNLKKLGVDVVSTAGNHCLDYGYDGLSRTIDVLDQADISHVGTYNSKESQDSILIKYVKGIKLAFIDFTFSSNKLNIPSDKSYCVNLIDKDFIKEQLDLAKKQSPDIIICSIHWGNENSSSVTSSQKEYADFIFENGADIILGTHPHLLQPMEKRTVTLQDGTTKDGFIIYSLGDFINGKNQKKYNSSVILELTITKHTDNKITIDKANYIPIYMYKDNSKKYNKFRLLDTNNIISLYDQGIDTSIGKNMYSTLKDSLNSIKSALGQ